MNDSGTKLRDSFDHAHAALAEEHGQIMTLIEALEYSPQASKLVHRLERLHTMLINHFAREQFPGGLYERMGAFGSRWHADLRGLILEHCMILSETRGLLDRARECAPAERHELQPEVIALIQQISNHEVKEHELASRLKSLTANGDA